MIELMVSDTEIVYVRSLQLRQPLSQMFPWMEYLVRVGWTPDAQKSVIKNIHVLQIFEN